MVVVVVAAVAADVGVVVADVIGVGGATDVCVWAVAATVVAGVLMQL